MKNKNNKGFTLIELLVVIAIIAILSTVVMAGLNSARAKGRDAKRLSDVKALQSALELFGDSCQGYPNLPAGNISGGVVADNAATLSSGENDTATVANCATPMSTYMSQMPANQGPGGLAYSYCGATLGPTAVNPVTAVLCGAASSASYLIGFTLEGVAGSLGLGGHQASPGGII
jgi:general secretion pathway protein G